MAKEVYWHLPGFCVNFYLYQVLFDLMKKYPDSFRENYKIGSVYGTFPGAIWNGGRSVFGTTLKSNMEAIIDTYNKLDVPVRFTWTNSLIEEKHVYDTYCNLIMEIANNGKNQVLCNSSVLEEYLRKEYPNFKFVSSTTKRMKDLEALKEELSKDYFMVVLDYDLNHDEKVLKELEPVAERVEILVDEICYPNCPKRVEHYKTESLYQLRFDKGKPFECPNIKSQPTFEDCKKRPAFISAEELSTYADRGYVNFKLVGRGLPQNVLIESILYYFTKDEASKRFVEEKIKRTLTAIKNSR